MNITLRPIALVAGLIALPFVVLAHFKLLEPAEWVKRAIWVITEGRAVRPAGHERR